MRRGKISESVLKRSVLRQIKNRREEVLKGAGVGVDCAFLSWKNSDLYKPKDSVVTAVSTQTIAFPVKNAAYLAIMAAANNLAAAGAGPIAVTLSLTLPEEAEEALLRELMGQAEICCGELDIQIAGGHTEASSFVRTPVITASVIGNRLTDPPCREGADEDLDIVVSKWIGLEGTSIIAREKEEELSRRYPARLLCEAQSQDKYLSVAPEAAIAIKSGVYAMHDARNGGIFGALWEVSQKIGVGLFADLKKIPVRQETIEVCEFFNLNPYELLSGGALIMVTADGGRLVRALEAEGIPAAVIGSTKAGNDKIIVNQDETRYLEPPKPDEIFKILTDFSGGEFHERTDFSDYREEQPD